MGDYINAIRDKSHWNFSTLSDAELMDKAKKIIKCWERHKFKEGESYDKYLYSLLKRYDLSVYEYYAGKELLGLEP